MIFLKHIQFYLRKTITFVAQTTVLLKKNHD